jgi:pimeloyl-ACP methyl ester carboxylesterase
MLQSTPTTNGTPAAGSLTVALVHGAFADSSSWLGVITALQDAGVAVQAISNPLRGVSSDAAYVANAVGQIAGPVLLVGHSYGGAVISVAAAQATNVVGLVYVAAYMPAEGETLLDLAGQFPPTALAAALRPATYPTADPATPGTEFYLDPTLYHDAFAADVPEEQTRAMAVAQRPVADIGFGEPAGPIAWTTLPSWYALATADQALGIDLERFLADRAGSITVEVDASHSVAVSQPAVIADLIMTAAGSVA